MAQKLKCPDCGAELPKNALKGICPACLIAFASEGSGAGIPAETDEGGLVGDYELLKEISAGGMGVVFQARQRSLNRLVALKMIRGGHLAGTGDIQRFRTEAEAAANLDYPNIVPIYEIGEHEGRHFFSMKLIEGQSLAEQIADGHWLLRADEAPERQHGIVRLMVTVARAVHHAHERGVLHRDLKPSNILLDERGEPHLTDFGLAKIIERDYGQTLTQAVLGTPGYMSPEQAAGKSKSITTAADIYSLGAILYELLTGKPPFQGESTHEILQQVQVREPTRPRLLNPDVAADLETICLKCLEKEPQRRYPTAKALADDLERWLRGEPITARPVGRLERALKWGRRHRGRIRLAVAAVASVAVGVTCLVWLWQLVRQGESQKELQRAENMFTEGDWPTALATLAHLLRGDPANRVAAERLWNALAQRSFLVPAAPAFPDGTRLVRWSSSGHRLVLAVTDSRGNSIQVRERGGRTVAELAAESQAIHTLDISEDGSFVAAGSDDHVRVWNVSLKELVMDRASPTGMVRQLQFLRSRRLLAVAGDRVTLWDLTDDRFHLEFKGQTALVLRAAVAPNANVLATADDAGTIQLWRLDSGQCWHTNVPAHTSVIRDLQFSPDGTQLVSAAADGTARIWDALSGECVGECRHEGPVYSAAFSPDSARLVTASRDKQARLWDAANAEPLGSPMRHLDSLSTAQFSPDGRSVVTAADDGTVRLWDGTNGLPLTEFAGFAQPVIDAGFSPDGQDVFILLETEGARRLTATPKQPLWQISNLPPAPALARLADDDRATLARAHNGPLTFLDASLDRRLLVTASADKTARVWLRKNLRPVGEALMHDAAVNCARFSPDGRRVVTSTASRKLRVWDVHTGAPLTDWIESDAPVASVWFTDTGYMVLTDSGRAWPVTPIQGTAPSWLPTLAEAVAGLRLNERKAAEPVPPSAFLELKTTLGAGSEASPLSAWVKQFLASSLDSPGTHSSGKP